MTFGVTCTYILYIFLDDDDDEFDIVPIGQCSAIYHYAARQPDELSIQPGIKITAQLLFVVLLLLFNCYFIILNHLFF